MTARQIISARLGRDLGPLATSHAIHAARCICWPSNWCAMRDAHQEFLAFYAGVMRAEASRRQHQPAFAAWLVECADKADAEAARGPDQLDLFGGMA